MLYLFFKRHPGESQSMLKHASEIVKYMPIDKNSTDLLTPLFSYSSGFSNSDNISTASLFDSLFILLIIILIMCFI